MVSKIRPYREIGISTFEKKFLNCVAPWILDYCSEVLGLQNFDSIKTASFVLTWAFTDSQLYQRYMGNKIDVTSHIEWLFESMNLLHIDDNSLSYDVPEFENKLFLFYENEWLRKINQLPKLQLYKSIKTREKL